MCRPLQHTYLEKKLPNFFNLRINGDSVASMIATLDPPPASFNKLIKSPI